MGGVGNVEMGWWCWWKMGCCVGIGRGGRGGGYRTRWGGCCLRVGGKMREKFNGLIQKKCSKHLRVLHNARHKEWGWWGRRLSGWNMQ